jgi:hypothetical protein
LKYDGLISDGACRAACDSVLLVNIVHSCQVGIVLAAAVVAIIVVQERFQLGGPADHVAELSDVALAT